jgi:Flp pilus assembly protein TadG
LPHALHTRFIGESHVFQPFKRLRSFASDQRGAIGVIFALSLFPMIAMTGAAIDYSNAMRLNARLKSAADTAALSAVRDYGLTLDRNLAESKGQDVFKSQLQDAGTKALVNTQVTFSFALDPAGLNYVSTASYSGVVNTYFGKFIKRDTINLAGSAQATYKKMTYKNFFFVVDASESMGLAASQVDLDNMILATKAVNGGDGCALVCHDREGRTKSNEEIAKDANIKTRLDVIKATIQSLLDETAASNNSTTYLRFAIYTLRKELTPLNATKGLAAVSSDYTALKNITAEIDFLGTHPEGWTYYPNLASLVGDIPESGNGATAATAENYVFLMTDGVADMGGDMPLPPNGICPGSGHCTGTLDATMCSAFKNSPKSATVGVLYTTYLNVGGNYWDHVNPFVNQIKPALTACASSGFFVEGTHDTEIVNGIKFLFYQAMSNVKLTQ